MSTETTATPAATEPKPPRVFLMGRRSSEDPPAPRLEVLDIKEEDETYNVETTAIEPTEVNRDLDTVITMQEFVQFIKLWKNSQYNKHMPGTQYLASAASQLPKMKWKAE